MHVIIADAGCGFDPPTYAAPRNPLSSGLELSDLERPGVLGEDEDEHFGLRGMHEHAAALGGALQIRSRPGQGAQVILTFTPGAKGAEDASQPFSPRDLRVLLVDDQPIFLEGLSNLLTAYGLHVVGMAQDGLQAQELARTARPDVIVMDIHMPVCDGITATRRIEQEFPEVEIVMLSVSAEDETLFEALKAGASGYLLKSMQAQDFFLLISGLESAAPPLAPQLAAKVLAEFQSRLQTETSLSEEQTHILSQLAQGRTYRQIAFDLHVSERTLKRYMKGIMGILHVESRAGGDER